jgi:microcystin-dependent protein
VDDELEKAIALIHAHGLNVTKDDGTSVDADPNNNVQSQTDVDPQLMQQMQQTAKNLGQAINDAQSNGIELQNSPDFIKNFIDLNDQLEQSGLCD